MPQVSSDKSGQELLYPPRWGHAPSFPQIIPCRNPGKCVKCHDDEHMMDPSHAVSCIRCHKGNPESDEELAAHEGLISDPGNLKTVDTTCGKCHPDEAHRVKLSAMALAPRMINHTRFAFGAQKTPDPLHGTVDAATIKQIPDYSDSSNLGDDLLRRSCLRCHLHTRGSSRPGEHRGTGCSACHVPYPNSEDGKPRRHVIVRSTGVNACLKCHNANHVGADYAGLFEKDFERGFRSPFVRGHQAPTIYGAEQHRLLPDVHFRAGMECMDCHTIDEVHGTGKPAESPQNGVTISCRGCHVDANHPAVMKQEDGTLMLLRGKGRRIPVWKPDLIPHQITEHREKLRCSACHGAWSFQDYGLHLMLEERADYWKWSKTSAQNDPQVQELLRRNVGTYAELVPPQSGPLPDKPSDKWTLPVSLDWLTGEMRPGIWFRGFTARRWAGPPLGRDHTGRISVMRPMHQYVVSHVDKDDYLLVDREIPRTGAGHPALIFNPYVPHTITRAARNCHECHGNPKAIGLGEGQFRIKDQQFLPIWKPERKIPGHTVRWEALVDEKGKQLQFSSHPGAGPLDARTIKRLLNPSMRHRALWHKYLKSTAP